LKPLCKVENRRELDHVWRWAAVILDGIRKQSVDPAHSPDLINCHVSHPDIVLMITAREEPIRLARARQHDWF